MKKFFALTMLSVCLFCNVTANAQSLYGGDVSDVINAFKLVGNEFDFRVWGTEYYTYKGIKRCELHFGNSQDNLIRFRLNNNNSVARMLITFKNSYSNSGFESAFQAGILSAAACLIYGVNEDESKKMWMSFTDDAIDHLFSYYMHKKYYAWSSKTQQYITMDVEMDTSKIDLYFYLE